MPTTSVPMLPNKTTLLALLRRARPHLEIAHQVRGRVRIRFGLGLLNVAGPEDLSDLKAAIQDLPGILDTRLNLFGGSLVVEYDPAVLPSIWWPTLLEGSPPEVDRVLDAVLSRVVPRSSSQPVTRR